MKHRIILFLIAGEWHWQLVASVAQQQEDMNITTVRLIELTPHVDLLKIVGPVNKLFGTLRRIEASKRKQPVKNIMAAKNLR